MFQLESTHPVVNYITEPHHRALRADANFRFVLYDSLGEILAEGDSLELMRMIAPRKAMHAGEELTLRDQGAYPYDMATYDRYGKETLIPVLTL